MSASGSIPGFFRCIRRARLSWPQVTEYEAGTIFSDDDIRITADHVDHIPADISPCYGLRIEAEGKVVTFSGDTAPCEGIAQLSRKLKPINSRKADVQDDDVWQEHRCNGQRLRRIGDRFDFVACELKKDCGRLNGINVVIDHKHSATTSSGAVACD